MIKRIVILQDEQLVVREVTRAARPVTAYAAAGIAAGRPATLESELADAADAGAADAVEDDESEEAVTTAPAASRLADVSKAASLKAERTVIEDTLRQVHWNRRRAAEQLGVSYKTLLNKIKECGISRK
jgi:DNA-binding NtrC family response regulator